MSDSKIYISLVDDHNVMRSALAGYLSNIGDFEVLFEASSMSEMKQKLNWEQKPNIILMDYSLRDYKGPECIKYIRKEFGEEIGVLGLSMHKESHVVNEVIEAGGNGYLFKGVDAGEMEQAIRKVHSNGFFINDLTRKLVFGNRMSNKESFTEGELTDTEKTIIVGICNEESSEEIANTTHLSLNTIKTYRKKILKKIGAKNSAGVVLYAIRNGIYEL